VWKRLAASGVGAFLLAQALVGPIAALAATIQTDLYLYQNGDTVTVTGNGFGVAETIGVVTSDPNAAVVDQGVATSDASGSFTYQFVLSATIAGLYTVTATGQTTGISASTQFDPQDKTTLDLNFTSPGSYGTAVVMTGTLTDDATTPSMPLGGATVSLATYSSPSCGNGQLLATLGTTTTATNGSNAGHYKFDAFPVVGSFFVQANYSGDGSHMKSPSACVALTINAASTSTSASVSPGTISTSGTTVVGWTVSSASGVTGATASGTATAVKDSGLGMLSCTPASFAVSAAEVSGSGFSFTAGPAQRFTCLASAAGTYTLHVHFADTDGNYSASDSSSLSLTVTIPTAALSVTPASGTYGGSVNVSATLTAGGTPLSGKTISFTLNGTSVGTATTNASGVASLAGVGLGAINAGTYATGVGASFAGDSSYSAASGSNALTVSKADPACSVTAYKLTYDGSPHTASGSCLAVDGKTPLSGLDLSGTSHADAGTYTDPWHFADVTGNYNNQAGSVTDEIDKATSTTVVNCPASVTYSGAALTPCSALVTGAGGLSQSLTVTYSDNTNAGTASASASYPGDANRLGSSGSATFAIAKATSATVVICPASMTYSGAPLTPCSASVTGAGGLNQSLTVNYSNNTNAGTASASASYPGDANHLGSSDSKTFTIDTADSTTVVTCPASVTYTGAALTPCSASVTGAGGLNQPLTVNYSNNTNAGTASASANYSGDTNHQGSSGSAIFTIAKANAACGVIPYKLTYDGSPHTATGTCLGVDGKTALGGLDLSGTSHTRADIYIDSWRFTDVTGNYNDQVGSVTDEVDKANPTCTVTAYSVTYDGNAHTATGSCVGVDGKTVLSGLDLSGTTHSNAGSYIDDWTFADVTGNYNNQGGSVTDEIDKATSTTVVNCPASVTYTGAALTPCSALVTGAGGLSQSLTMNYSDNTNAGTASASASYPGDANYLGSSGSAIFTIDKANASCSVTPYELTYDGGSHTASGTCVGVMNEKLSGLDLTTTSHTDAGVYTDSWSFTDVTGNYNNEAGSVTDEIDKANASCSVTPYKLTYDGGPHTPSGICVGVMSEKLSGLDLTTTSHTDAGVYTDPWSFTDVTGNYNNEAGSVTDEIDKATPACSVTSYKLTYDGSSHTASGTCSAVDGKTPLSGLDLSGTSHADAGTYTDPWSFTDVTGNYNNQVGSVTDEIDKATSTTVVNCPASVTYSGAALTPCSALVTGAGGLSQSLTVTYSDNTNAGTASASASYPGDANHLDSSGSTTFTIAKAAQAISFGPLADKIIGSPDFMVSATGGASGNPVTFASTTTAVCSISGSTVHLISVGTCTIIASQDGNSNYLPAASVPQSFKILYASSGTCVGDAGHQILQPINADGSSVFKQGSTIPIKFRVCDANGSSVGPLPNGGSIVQSLVLTKVISGSGSTNETVVSTTPDTAFRWDSTNQQWIFNLSTKNLVPNATYYYTITLNDGSTIGFRFGLR
jgi:hypothetical protein